MSALLHFYIQLGKYFSYDEDYVTAETIETRKEIFDKDINEIENDKVVCSSISKIYIKLLNCVGINAEEIYKEGKFLGHMFVKVKIDNKFYCTDFSACYKLFEKIFIFL